jgi:tetratricopeptide (TPR) repeat protein
MFKTAIIVGVLGCLSTTLQASFSDDFGAALALYNKKEYPQTQEAFVKLAETAPTPKSKAECLGYAALSLGRQKQYDKAMELAQTIAVKPISIACRMEIMLGDGKYKELIEAFKDEDIGAWPDYCIHKGFYHRGTAYRLSGQPAAAAKDLEKAIENSVTADWFQVMALDELGGVYLALKEDQKAIDAYRKVLSFPAYKGVYTYLDAVLSLTGILTRQGKFDEALTELHKLDPAQLSGNWKFLTLKAYGDIALAQGKKDEAVVRYKEALNVTGVSQSYVDGLTKKIAEITGK